MDLIQEGFQVSRSMLATRRLLPKRMQRRMASTSQNLLRSLTMTAISRFFLPSDIRLPSIPIGRSTAMHRSGDGL